LWGNQEIERPISSTQQPGLVFDRPMYEINNQYRCFEARAREKHAMLWGVPHWAERYGHPIWCARDSDTSQQ
jgi:hypothetical protein